MGLWSLRPESELGWALWLAGLALQLLAVIAVIRELRGRRANGWDVAALAFVILGGPAAALAFLGMHAFFERRTIRREKEAVARISRAR